MNDIEVDTYIIQFLASFKPYKSGTWCYEDGIILSGSWYLYQATENKRYVDFIISYLNNAVSETGTLSGYEPGDYNIDNINSGKVLFDVYHKTGHIKYKQAIDLLYMQLKDHPRTESGSFWHKKKYPYQVWLDGLYMAQPFYARYIKEFQDSHDYADIIRQFNNVRTYLFDKTKQLYCHAYDETKSMPWADPITGQSPTIWLRSVGWFAMALVDVLELIGCEKTINNMFQGYLEELVEGMIPHQTENGMWYQVVDKPEYKGNYLETSGTLMMAYTLLKAVRYGYLKYPYRETGIAAFKGVLENNFSEDTKGFHLGGTCQVAGLDATGRDGSIAYYLSEPIVTDEAKGVAPLMMAYSEMLRI